MPNTHEGLIPRFNPQLCSEREREGRRGTGALRQRQTQRETKETPWTVVASKAHSGSL